MTLDMTARAAVARVRKAVDGENHEYCQHEFNVHRWIVAWGKEDDAATNLKRHLNFREIHDFKLSEAEEEFVQCYAPVTILGKNKTNGNKIVLIEQSGKIDISNLVDNMQLTGFMRAKFAMMERLHTLVERAEKETGEQTGGMLVMDLQGLCFTPKLLSVLAGPYRIMWGTLFDQYPQLLQQILIVNAPAFVNLLYQTCIPFIPSDYKDKIVISSGNATKKLQEHIDVSVLPPQYGGNLETDSDGEYEFCMPLRFTIIKSYPQNNEKPIGGQFASHQKKTADRLWGYGHRCKEPKTVQKAEPISDALIPISISAGGFMLQTYKWTKGTQLELYIQTDSEFTYWMFHTPTSQADETSWREIYPGCERPALQQCDRWTWTVPLDGFYHIRYGNEKAWMFSVTIQHLIYKLSAEGKIPQTPLEVKEY